MLTSELIDATPAGREMNLLVIEHVLGWRFEERVAMSGTDCGNNLFAIKPDGEEVFIEHPPNVYSGRKPWAVSTDPHAALDLFESAPGFYRMIEWTERGYKCKFSWDCNIAPAIQAATLPLAVCRARLHQVLAMRGQS